MSAAPGEWRSKWVCEPVSRTAVHTTGVVARVMPSGADADRECLILERAHRTTPPPDVMRRLADEVMSLWSEGAFQSPPGAAKRLEHGKRVPRLVRPLEFSPAAADALASLMTLPGAPKRESVLIERLLVAELARRRRPLSSD